MAHSSGSRVCSITLFTKRGLVESRSYDREQAPHRCRLTTCFLSLRMVSVGDLRKVSSAARSRLHLSFECDPKYDGSPILISSHPSSGSASWTCARGRGTLGLVACSSV